MNTKILGIIVSVSLLVITVPIIKSQNNKDITQIVSNTRQLCPQIDQWNETQKIYASDAGEEDYFSRSVSLSGDTALIGANLDDQNGEDSGAAYVFTRTGITWAQQTKLLALDGAPWNYFGYAVSLDGDTALIGADRDNDHGADSGSAYVFIRTGTTWTQQAKLLALDGESGDNFGWSVSLNGDTALIGAWQDNDNGADSGSAYVFTRTGSTWTQQAKLLAPDGAPNDVFGCSVSLSGDTALIGTWWDNDSADYAGSAYVFTRTGTTWNLQTKLLAPDGEAHDFFGWSVSLSGDTALIGAYSDDDDGFNAGSAYIFIRTGTTWTQQTKLHASDGLNENHFGYSVSLFEDTALIAAPDDANKGSAYIFTRSGTIWTQQDKLLASDGTMGDFFGQKLAVTSDTALIGALGDDDYGQQSGAVYVFMKGPLPDLDIIFKGGLGVNAVIKNNGGVYARDVVWMIHVEGGFQGGINKTIKGVIDSIQTGESRIIRTGLLVGLGPISFIAKADYEEETGEGNQFFIFSIVKKTRLVLL